MEKHRSLAKSALNGKESTNLNMDICPMTSEEYASSVLPKQNDGMMGGCHHVTQLDSPSSHIKENSLLKACSITVLCLLGRTLMQGILHLNFNLVGISQPLLIFRVHIVSRDPPGHMVT